MDRANQATSEVDLGVLSLSASGHILLQPCLFCLPTAISKEGNAIKLVKVESFVM